MSKLPEDYMTIAITLLPSQLTSVYAILGGAASVTVSVGDAASPLPEPRMKPGPAQNIEPVKETALADPTAVTEFPGDVDDGAPDLDAHGWPWSADLHASTKGTTKEGLWRMKPGATRPAPKPGFPKDTGIEAETASTSASASPVTKAEPAPASTTEEDDEFAAFRAAAAKTDAEDATVKASVPARKWTDADLGALCNQAAVKLGDPLPVKAIIAEYVPEGETPHSRNIPEGKRAEFAAAIEAKAGIEFAG